MNPILKHPSAWVPLVLSLTVLAAFIITIWLFGTPHTQPDEGTAAHLFQIWLVVEVLLVAFFAVRWLPQKPKETLPILALQIAAILAACAPVFLLHL